MVSKKQIEEFSSIMVERWCSGTLSNQPTIGDKKGDTVVVYSPTAGEVYDSKTTRSLLPNANMVDRRGLSLIIESLSNPEHQVTVGWPSGGGYISYRYGRNSYGVPLARGEEVILMGFDDKLFDDVFKEIILTIRKKLTGEW